MKSRVGTHIRMRYSLQELVERALSLHVPFFQCFFVPQETGKLLEFSDAEIREFLKARAHFDQLYCHISYWVNLSSLGKNGYPQLRQEIMLAQQLEFTHVVLHAGSAKGAVNKQEGIDALAIALNNLFKKEPYINVLLENTCHSNLAVGSDIADFKHLLEKLDKPERIGFCIDTAHAHSFGYDIITSEGQQAFIGLLDTMIGLERIKLIHLNDTSEKMGSFIDRHAVVGKGLIGEDALKQFAMHPLLRHIPLLIESPEISVEDELGILEKMRSW